MQEHEYVYEHGFEQGQEYALVRESGQHNNLIGQELERVEERENEEISAEDAMHIEALEELQDRRATLRLGRWLVAGLGASFLATLAALWLSSTLISAPDQFLPVAFLQMLAANRVLVLCVPLVCLAICYFSLRSLTGEIMAVPERKLDERQKTLRNQAQHSAFKIVKFSSLLIPVALLLPHLPWPDSPSTPVYGAPVGISFVNVFDGKGTQFSVFVDPASGHWHRFGQMAYSWTILRPAPLISPASSLEIAVAGGVLLFTLLLMFSGLPMAVLAWRGKA